MIFGPVKLATAKKNFNWLLCPPSMVSTTANKPYALASGLGKKIGNDETPNPAGFFPEKLEEITTTEIFFGVMEANQLHNPA